MNHPSTVLTNSYPYLKYIWSSTGSYVSTRTESRPAEVFLFETTLWSMSFDKASSIDDISKLNEFVFVNWSYILSMSARLLLDRINSMADKILSLSMEYVSFSSLISDAMTSFFSWAIRECDFFLIPGIELICWRKSVTIL